jgi:cytochrome c oxidase assembly protein subunit 15
LLHRGTAYLLCVLIPIFFFVVIRLRGNRILTISNYTLLTVLLIQVTLGIFTVINSLSPSIFPILGVLHQAGGILLLMAMLFVNYQFGKGGYK